MLSQQQLIVAGSSGATAAALEWVSPPLFGKAGEGGPRMKIGKPLEVGLEAAAASLIAQNVPQLVMSIPSTGSALVPRTAIAEGIAFSLIRAGMGGKSQREGKRLLYNLLVGTAIASFSQNVVLPMVLPMIGSSSPPPVSYISNPNSTSTQPGM